MNESGFEIKNYYHQLQQGLLDFRDNRGKCHDLAFVLLSFFVAILRSSGLLNCAKIHRTMRRDHALLQADIGVSDLPFISYSQLKRILEGVDYECFSRINSIFFSKQIIFDGLVWESIDGKELRGTIDSVSGARRAENIISQVNHSTGTSQVLGFYRGEKESEKTLVRKYFENSENLSGKGYRFDALHTSSEVLSILHTKDAIYLAQVKKIKNTY